MKPDYYLGQTFDKLTQSDEEFEWGVALSGGAVITNKNPEFNTPPDEEMLHGKTFLNFKDDGSIVELIFGHTSIEDENVTVFLKTDSYTVADPNYTGDEEVWPGVVDETNDTPPDPSPDRVAGGPEAPMVEPLMAVEGTESAPKRTRKAKARE